ncbi:MAG TPA: zf-HC2 domain-containing protein, partial [Blastocatellia bacterium]|nr:zf-HC2 domain-containing protein [Blastocatellia bacterium]
MFNKHVSKLLSAYCHKELDASEADRVRAHLEACRRCSQEYEEIKLGIHFAEQLPTLTAPDTLWGEIENLLDASAGNSSAGGRRLTATRRFAGAFAAFAHNRLAVASAVVVVGLVTALTWYYFRSVDAPWEVTSLEGTVLVDSDRVDEIGSLSVGEWLETGGSSRARISVADIGFVEVEPQTSVRLVRTRLTEHRLELKRGTVHAMIFAPPRLFFVDTPSATAVDYGCAYTLEVDDAGASLLHVTAGWVSLAAAGGRESL